MQYTVRNFLSRPSALFWPECGETIGRRINCLHRKSKTKVKECLGGYVVKSKNYLWADEHL
jgi:hypothetical protein